MRRTLAVIAATVALTAGGSATAALAGQPVTAAARSTVAANSPSPNTGGSTTVTKTTSDKTGLWGLLGLLGLGGLAKRKVKADDNYDTTTQRR
jgi:hypothetical protein